MLWMLDVQTCWVSYHLIEGNAICVIIEDLVEHQGSYGVVQLSALFIA